MFDNYDYFKSEYKKYQDHDWSNDRITLGGNPDVIFHPFGQKDMVNSLLITHVVSRKLLRRLKKLFKMHLM